MAVAEKFSTSDTPLAAYLVSHGIALQSVEYDYKARFIFTQSEKLAELLVQFETEQRQLTAFLNAYRSLISRIKERY